MFHPQNPPPQPPPAYQPTCPGMAASPQEPMAPPYAGPGYPQPMPAGYGYPQPYMQPAPQVTQQSSTNVVVVGGAPPAQTVIVKEKGGVNHCLHCCVSIIFPPWIIVWILLCVCKGC